MQSILNNRVKSGLRVASDASCDEFRGLPVAGSLILGVPFVKYRLA
jgi:hypothetical protein